MGDYKSPSWHEAILKERTKALQQGDLKISDWAEAKERIKRNLSCK